MALLNLLVFLHTWVDDDDMVAVALGCLCHIPLEPLRALVEIPCLLALAVPSLLVVEGQWIGESWSSEVAAVLTEACLWLQDKGWVPLVVLVFAAWVALVSEDLIWWVSSSPLVGQLKEGQQVQVPLGGADPDVSQEQLQWHSWLAVHWVLAWCVERDKKASDNQSAGTPRNMGFEICVSLSSYACNCRLTLNIFLFPIVHKWSHFLMQLAHVWMDIHLPLHKWSSRRNNNHPLVMSSLNYVTWFWLILPAILWRLKNPDATTQVNCNEDLNLI